MAEQLATKPGLAAQGARVGAEFRLGACTQAWSGRRYAPRLAAGALLLVLLCVYGLVFLFGTTGASRTIAGGIDSFIFTFAVLLIVLPPRSWTDQLFLCQAGMVLLDAREPEPKVLRWAYLDSITVTLGSNYENYFVDTCVLRDRAGATLTVSRHLKAAFPGVVAAAEWVLAPRLVPDLIARLDSGEPVTIGDVTADRYGLTLQGTFRRFPSWQESWSDIRSVKFTLEGQHVTVKTGRWAGDSKPLAVDGKPNSFVFRYLVAHVAAAVGFRVEGFAPGWNGEAGYNPDVTLVAPTLAPPGTALEPEQEPDRVHGRHPVRTAFLAALVVGFVGFIAAALTLL